MLPPPQRRAHLSAIAVIGFSSEWETIPSSSGGIDPRANESVPSDERREKMKRAIRLQAGRTSTPRSANARSSFAFDLPLRAENANAPSSVASITPSSVAIDLSGRREYLKISINIDKFTWFFDKKMKM